MIEFNSGSATSKGRVRGSNQDRYLVTDSVFVVADGMGGHQAGEVAAEMAVEQVPTGSGPQSLDEFVELVNDANAAIYERASNDPSMRGMGTTFVALAGIDGSDGPSLGVVNVGDSRLYRRGETGLEQITDDHSLVETLVRDGRLTREEAAVHPQRNILTRALGIDRKVLADSWLLTPTIADRYVLCSDGLFNELTNDEIFTLLSDVRDPGSAAQQLVDEACAAGGHDNVTVVVVDIADLDRPIAANPDRVAEFHPAVPGATQPSSKPMSVATPNSTPILTWRLGLFMGAVLTLMTILVVSVVMYARSGYFVGVDGPEVVIYKGRPNGVLWFDPTFEESVQLSVVDLSPSDLDAVQSGVTFDSLDEAKRFGFELYTRAENQP